MSIPNLNATIDTVPKSHEATYLDGKFQNATPIPAFSLGDFWQYLKRAFTESTPNKVPEQSIPVLPITQEALTRTQQDTLWRLGHSSILLKLNNEFWLLDPVFSERASPFQFAGPKRFHQPPISIDELPPLAGVLISHNHYDHLDKSAVKALNNKVERFIVPLGVGGDLRAWGVEANKIEELDWWQSSGSKKVKITATPAHHFSGRGLSDRDKTLWASYVLETGHSKLFFSGDSGYFDGFKKIGEHFGAFDLTLMETGAYDSLWPDVHMHPEESLQAHLDLNGKRLLPIHNGTFSLAFHSWTEPFEQIQQLAGAKGVDLATPKMGEALALKGENHTSAWWKE